MEVLEKIVDMKVKDRLIKVKFRKEETSVNVLYETSFSLYEGKLYGILCNHRECGWGISYLLSGKEKISEEYIVIGGKDYVKGQNVKEGWYVGEGIKIALFHEKTLKKQIAFALKKSGVQMGVDDIIKKFDLSLDKINHKFSHLGWESWRASVAIGYAYGKKIFCFPWLDTSYFKEIIYNTGFFSYIDILKKEGKTIVIPTTDKFILENISDKIIRLCDPRFHEYKYIEEFIQQQKDMV